MTTNFMKLIKGYQTGGISGAACVVGLFPSEIKTMLIFSGVCLVLVALYFLTGIVMSVEYWIVIGLAISALYILLALDEHKSGACK